MKCRDVIELLLLAPAFSGCNELTGGPGHISQRIGEVANDPAAKEVDLAKLTTFGWDRLHLFKPGTPKKEICAFIGASDGLCEQVIRHQSVAGESMTLVFSLKDQLTHAELHALSNGRFNVAPDKDGIPKESCVFKIRREPATDGKQSFGWSQNEA